jgi:cytochrome d ubiquinol oxidase subunit II
MIHTLWFLVLSLMLTGYAILDGFDLGVGMLHFLVGRTADERTRLIDTIGPVWNGNEVWLLAAGGAMVTAFPTLYAASFSGFYLALMLVLWLLILRGLALEFRHQLDNHLWLQAWDVVFAGSSLLLALLFGVAIGNVLRGVPLDADGRFQGSFALMLNPFAVLGGVLGVVTLAMHGAGWLAVKTTGDLQSRSRRWQRVLAWTTLSVIVAFVAASFAVRPDFVRNFTAMPVLLLVPIAGLAAFVGVIRFGGHDDAKAFASSAAIIASILGSAAAGLYPTLLPALPGSAHAGLDIYNASSPEGSLRTALAIYLTGMAIVSVYLVRIYRVWRGETRTYSSGAHGGR